MAFFAEIIKGYQVEEEEADTAINGGYIRYYRIALNPIASNCTGPDRTLPRMAVVVVVMATVVMAMRRCSGRRTKK